MSETIRHLQRLEIEIVAWAVVVISFGCISGQKNGARARARTPEKPAALQGESRLACRVTKPRNPGTPNQTVGLNHRISSAGGDECWFRINLN